MDMWRSVPGYEGSYEVSYEGEIRSLARTVRRADGKPLTVTGRMMRPGIGSRGYRKVTLIKDGRSRTFSVHSLVAQTFLPKPPRHIGSDRDGFVVNHKDGDLLNNHVGNLEYITALANISHARASGRLSARGIRNHKAKLTDKQIEEIRLAYSLGHTQTYLAGVYGVCQTTISRIVNRSGWSHLV